MGKLLGEFICQFFLCYWTEWVHKHWQIMELGSVAWLSSSVVVSSAHCLFPQPVIWACSIMLFSLFLFLFSFSLPAMSQLALYVISIPLAHPCPMVLSQVFWCPLCMLLDPSPSLSPTFFISHQSQISSILPPGLFQQSHFLSGPILLHPGMPHIVLLLVVSPVPIHLSQIA